MSRFFFINYSATTSVLFNLIAKFNVNSLKIGKLDNIKTALLENTI